MSKVIKLPSGNTVTLRDPKELRQKDRAKLFESANGHTDMLQALSMTNGLLAILIESWSFDLIIPSISIKSLDELTIPDYDAIAAETIEAQSVLFPSVTQTPESEANPDSPFDNSNA
jgi:hypothetical protein